MDTQLSDGGLETTLATSAAQRAAQLRRPARTAAAAGFACDLCGARAHYSVLDSVRLDGPLVRCEQCGLYFVIRPDAASPERRESGAVSADIVRLVDRAVDLGLVDARVEEGERRWREQTARERVHDLRRFVRSGRFLEIGSSTGDMLGAAGHYFTATGLEPDAANCGIARVRGFDCINSTLAGAGLPDRAFDVAASYHVIEHVPSPQAELRELQRVVKPGGWLVMETPNIDSIWFRVLRTRWRQLIPDHIFFFAPATMRKLCADNGFEVVELRSVGRGMSVRFFLNRLAQYHAPTARALASIGNTLHLNDRTVRVRLSDVMRVYARRLP